MSETDSQQEQDKWSEARARVADVIARKYPDAKDPEALCQIATNTLSNLERSASLKFVETIVDGESYKMVEPPESETQGEGLPVEELVDFLDLGDSHGYEFGIPDPEKNPDYLQNLSNILGKPIEAFLPGKEAINVQPQELAKL